MRFNEQKTFFLIGSYWLQAILTPKMSNITTFIFFWMATKFPQIYLVW